MKMLDIISKIIIREPEVLPRTLVTQQANVQDKQQSSVEIYVAEFNNLWQEVLTRIEIRERIGSSSVTTQGIILAVALGTQPLNALAATNFRLSDILLLLPVVACVLQAMFLRQTVRIAMIIAYLVTDLNERISEHLDDKDEWMARFNSSFNWLNFTFGEIQSQMPLIERLLTLFEFNISLLLASFGLIVYFLISNQPFTEVFYISFVILLIGIVASAWIELSSFKLHFSYTSPKTTVVSYIRAIEKRQVEYALKMISPSLRAKMILQVKAVLGRKIQKIKIQEQELHDSHIIKISARIKKREVFVGEYTLKQIHGRWYIIEAKETIEGHINIDQ